MSEQIGELASALAKAQGAFEVPKKSHTAKAGAYSYHYSTLDELIAATRPALVANGLATTQNVSSPDGGNVAVSTSIFHSSGQWIEFDPIVLPSGTTPQQAGGATTYARRYSLGAALNVAAEEDDDAQSVKPEPANRFAPGAPVTMPPPVPVRPSASKLAAEINAGIAAGHQKAAVAPASSLKAPIRGKQQSRYTPPLPPNGETMPPVTEDDIPFIWLMPFIVPALGLLGVVFA